MVVRVTRRPTHPLLAAAVTAASALWVGRHVLRRRIDGQIDELLSSAQAWERGPICAEDLADLPEPVRRWLRWCGVVGTAIPATVRLRQEGELRLGADRWCPFTAEQYYSTQPPGFVWRARVRMAPGVFVVGTDSYGGGRGALEMRLFGLIPVARDTGPEMDDGDLLRYLNEVMWFPAGALLPQISWESIDATSARATMTYGDRTGTARFFFAADGRPTTMVADRYAREHGAVVPWSTPLAAYGEFGGIRVPTEGEASYTSADGESPYIRLKITDLTYEVRHRS